MCYFITLAVRQQHAAFVSESAPRDLSLWPMVNRSLQASLPADYEQFVIVSGRCSCELYSAPAAAEEPARRNEHLRRKYTDRGWSAAKIERAVAHPLANKKRLPEFVGYRSDVVDLVTAIVARTSTTALFVHFYSGDQRIERLEIGASLRISLKPLRPTDGSGSDRPKETANRSCYNRQVRRS